VVFVISFIIINFTHKTVKNSKKKFLSIRVKMINRQYNAMAFENTTLVIFSLFSEESTIAKNKIKNARKCL
jgi:hypothetical protein